MLFINIFTTHIHGIDFDRCSLKYGYLNINYNIMHTILQQNTMQNRRDFGGVFTPSKHLDNILHEFSSYSKHVCFSIFPRFCSDFARECFFAHNCASILSWCSPDDFVRRDFAANLQIHMTHDM